jgi:RNA polymerase sigma factor (sigma-70 family)
VQQSVRRYVRDSQAKKRAQRPDSLDDACEIELTVGEAEHPEEYAKASALQDLITEALNAAPDKRLRRIFHLWAINDRTTEDIAAQFQLHPSRVRALLLQARRLLMAYQPLNEWHINAVDYAPSPRQR